ncbi:MAG: ATP-binding cassette domain-containing protein, partial [Bacteroidota bacterium]|nr:ATP-binding cassette domain-containing protein [Bacteroidota bacterium]MDX5430822.1 ATP-binding cassette domain-containing protein [Bacteroidota bacterium]
MIEIKDLSKIYRTEDIETMALQSIHLQIGHGEFVAVMGPSGCGKSTLLNLIGLLDQPSSGSYCLNGKETANLKEKDRSILRKNTLGFV